jgi:hypothetical protein
MIMNKDEKTICASCEEPKPDTSAAGPKPTPLFAANAAPVFFQASTT